MNAERTVITFRSSSFNSKESKDYFINAENFGDDLARWLADQLDQRGITVDRSDDFPGQEDFGWFLNCATDEGSHCVVVGHHYDEDAFEWVLWVERKCGLMKSLFGGRKKDISPRVPSALHVALSSSSDIDSIRWHRQTDFDRGIFDHGTPEP